jgi:hypothetical protein
VSSDGGFGEASRDKPRSPDHAPDREVARDVSRGKGEIREICRFASPIDVVFGDGIGIGTAPSFGDDATVSRDATCVESVRVFEMAFAESRRVASVARGSALVVGTVTFAATIAVAGETAAGNGATTGGAWAWVAAGGELIVDSTDNDSTNTTMVAIARSTLMSTKPVNGAVPDRRHAERSA